MRIHRQAIKTVLTLNKSAVGDFPLLLNELIKDYVVSLNSRSVCSSFELFSQKTFPIVAAAFQFRSLENVNFP